MRANKTRLSWIAVVAFLCLFATAPALWAGTEVDPVLVIGQPEDAELAAADRSPSVDLEVVFAGDRTWLATAVPAPADKCFCTCTAIDDDTCSEGQAKEVPSGGNCTSLNGQGCLVAGKNGRLSDCKRGPASDEPLPDPH